MNDYLNKSVISRRDYFAAAALQGLASTIDHSYYAPGAESARNSINRNLAKTAIALADEMLLQLKEEQSDPLHPAKSIGERLRWAREQKNLSVEELERKIDFDWFDVIEELENLKVSRFEEIIKINNYDFEVLKGYLFDVIQFLELDPKDFIESD